MNLNDITKPPKMLGFDPDRLHALDELVQHGITVGYYPAAVYVVLRHRMIAAQGVHGLAQPDAGVPVRADMDTIFDMASLTKPMTALLLLQCVEQGLLHLNQTVADHIVEAAE